MTHAQAEAKRQAEVMIAFSEGKEIEYRSIHKQEWIPSPEPTFAWDYYEYRIAAQKPKRVKMKFIGWTDGENLFRLKEGIEPKWPSKRVPELDKEVEVVEP